ncbi:MAG TPA: HEPN domain-containing protein [bacterium]|nr:HEPN domain-containing protein [bacterium]
MGTLLMSSDLKQMALDRVRDAQILLEARRYVGAYYLIGYAVECALKAVIAKRTRRHEFPEKERVDASWTHNFDKLFDKAALGEGPANNQTAIYLATVKKWKPDSRYEPTKSKNEAEDLFEAVTHPHDGVLSWLRTFW